jgi:hypothetical protein
MLKCARENQKEVYEHLYTKMCTGPESGSRDSVVGIATGCGLDDRGVRVRVVIGLRTIFSSRLPDRLWGPLSLLSMGTGGSFPTGKAAGA